MIFVATVSTLESLRFKSPPLMDVVILIVLVFISLISLVIALKYTRSKLTKDIKNANEVNFKHLAVQYNLSKDEQILLYQMSQTQITEIEKIFTSQILFEQCIENFYKTLDDIQVNTTDSDSAISSIRDKLHFRFVKRGQPVTSTRNFSVGSRISLANFNVHAVITTNHERSFTLRLEGNSHCDFKTGNFLELGVIRKYDGIYNVMVEVISTVNSFIECKHSIDLNRYQSRKDFRLDLQSSVSFIRRESTDTQKIYAQMVNVSGGGLCYESIEHFKLNEIVTVGSCVNFVHINNFKFKVLALSHIRGDLYRYHGQFVNLTHEQKECIITRIFSRVRETLELENY